MDEPENEVARWAAMPTWVLSQAAQHGSRLVVDGFASVGARGYHYRLLATLEDFGPASQAALGRRSGIHLSDMVATVNELAELGLVERAADPSDRRRNVITLTTAGKRHLRRLESRLAAAQEELLAPLSADERRRLVALLATLLEHHDRRAGVQEERWR
ncbi:MarR family transcriptional regulator [Kribbella antibiotica]|uniref:MarR family transcriptional regulator n=1 Tax=Kribbella antibiotica TaxID=190195 RepID=A0A4R4ZPV9_9ACTN|nr:MarR family transcriptional regulator [Kribbella antibiotica]TDD60953.1 MarR family transcriptional regulator [Kribbella antibiotica]